MEREHVDVFKFNNKTNLIKFMAVLSFNATLLQFSVIYPDTVYDFSATFHEINKKIIITMQYSICREKKMKYKNTEIFFPLAETLLFIFTASLSICAIKPIFPFFLVMSSSKSLLTLFFHFVLC